MDTSSLKKFAQAARRQLIGQVTLKLDRVLAEGSLARRESAKAVAELESQIKSSSRHQVIEQVAYTWFNRFCALRFMDVNRYTQIGTVSPAEGFSQPELLADAKQGVIDDDWKVDKERILGLLNGSLPSSDPQAEAYQLLLVAACNSYHTLMPFMFERIADYTELLIPDDLLSDSSILTATREALTPEACQSVETIGWLYQFYISEKKDDVFAALKKGKKITPENIPAATQLFTPHWIVRYLVENSLGRLWMLNHPDSRLVEQMDYYIRPEEPETDFLRISSPEEIKICDPACGSGHMLTYAFDLLYAIYEEQGYQATDIPRLILTHNLYGIEIDQRAGALAAFALTMKAREKYRRFLSSGKVVQPNICVLENIKVDPQELDDYIDKVGRDLFSGGLQGVVNQWEEADNFGSLIRPLVTDVSEVLELLRERQMGEDLFLAGVHQKVLKALRQADYLSPKYHVVVANPPFAGKKGMNSELKEFLKQEFPKGRSDLFSAFIQRCIELSYDRCGFVSPYVWMFIASFEEFRGLLLQTSTIQSLIQLEYNAFEPACIPVCTFVLKKGSSPEQLGTYIKLSQFTGHQNQGPRTREAIKNPSVAWRFSSRTSDYTSIPSSPIAYWLPKEAVAAYAKGEKLEDYCYGQPGLQTSDNSQFIRLWHEVAANKTEFGSATNEEASNSGRRWFPYLKGGGFRKWYGNHEFVVDWEFDGKRIKDYVTEKYPYLNGNIDYVVKDRGYYFRRMISYSKITSSTFSARVSGTGFLFDVAGSAVFPNNPEQFEPVLGFFCSKLANFFIKAQNPTLNVQSGDIDNLPYLGTELDGRLKELRSIADEAVSLSRADWDSSETSWEFAQLELVTNASLGRLNDAYSEVRDRWNDACALLQKVEEANNELFLDAYSLSDELSPQADISEITLRCNPYCRFDDEDKSDSELEALLLADTMREFISYAVGCMLGRYSLDKPGLILANQGETADDYRQQIPEPTFAPDEDNVIPLLDGDWFTDDISERFKEFLKVTFGTEHYEENLTFLENALYPDNLTGKKRKTIRDYFLKEFYNHHIKLYKKRPIYWLFSSPKGTFNALIYLHRYRPDTVSTVLQYLRDFRDKLAHRMDHQQMVADSGGSTKSEQTKALKEVTAIKKQLKELEDYERDTLFPLAQKKIEIDLDDGVKHNYPLFGKALKKVTGLS
ncbi:MAG: BREX-1 system adenine-specific DNA-methyltransferase PglX [Phycisphaera sp. RhM]|nr:BREX-1 system adenine-specific DNA-methyltransferase PglX [Phycisphaera sp. RhM]